MARVPPRTRRGRSALAALLPLAVSCAAFAADPPQADGLWRGSTTAALSATSGNTRTSAVLLKADGVRLTTGDKITLGGSVNYARSRADNVDSTTSNKMGAFGQYDYDLSSRLVAFGRLAADRDKISFLSLRMASSAGLGWKWVDTDTDTFTVYGGLGYSRDRYSQPQTINGMTGTRFERSNLLFAEESQHKLTSTLQLKQRLEVSPSIGGDRAMLVKFTSDVAVAINSSMNLSVGVIDNYNNRPPLGQKRNDVSLFTGLDIKFGPR